MITGSIPSELGLLKKLERLSLRQNGLSYTIPTEIGNLTNLEDLRLSGNTLNGLIPFQIGSLTKLTSLALLCTVPKSHFSKIRPNHVVEIFQK